MGGVGGGVEWEGWQDLNEDDHWSLIFAHKLGKNSLAFWERERKDWNSMAMGKKDL